MGCTPSMQVSHSGMVYCRGQEPSPSPSPTPSPTPLANHQHPPPPPDATTTTTAHNQNQGPSGRNQVGPARPGFPQAWNHPAPPQMDSYLRLGPMRVVKKQLRVLLVFGREDSVCEAWRAACVKRGHEVTIKRTVELAVKCFQEQYHPLVVVDARSTRHFDATSVCNGIRQTDGGQTAVLLAVVKRSFADRDNATVGPMLKMGFNRVLVESSTVGWVLNEVAQLEHGELAGQSQIKALQAVFSALDACKELIHITDNQHRILYVNRPCEQMLGYTLEDLAGRNIWELHTAWDHHHRQQQQQQDPAKALPSQGEHQKSSVDFRTSSTDHHKSHIEYWQGEPKVLLDISEAVNLQMRRGREWEGVLSCRRRSGELLHLPSRVVPGSARRSSTQYLVYLSDSHHHPLPPEKLSQPPERSIDLTATTDHFHPRGSIKSLRKGSHSHDIRSINSDGTQNLMRRQSLVKLHSLTIEAPITRVVNIISAAQDSSPSYVAQALEKALEILRSTELYSPQLVSSATSDNTKPVPADPVATDLLGGLLAQAPKPLLSARRSSNDTASKQGSQSGVSRSSLPALQQHASAAIRDLLAEHLSWNFDIFKLEKISDKRPLVWLGMSLLCRFDAPDTLCCDEQTLQNWLTLIEANYHAENSYHNSTHAADVLQATAYFLDRERIRQLLDPLDVVACLIAAVVHDVDHPGKNSAFLCNTDNELALLYNDQSVLESHHAAVAFKHTHSDSRVNIFKGLERDTYKHLRSSIVDMVLATDMTKHFEHLSKFLNMAATSRTPLREELDPLDTNIRDSPEPLDFASAENLVVIKRMLIKCADVSNPLRPLHFSRDWAYRIANEYFNQTEEEKRRGLPIVMPQFDRTTCSIPKSQIGFIDFFINDMFDGWDALADIPELMEQLRRNYQYWKEQEEPLTHQEEQEDREEEEEEQEEKEQEEQKGEGDGEETVTS